MIGKIISFSLRNRLMVLLLAAGLFGWGLLRMQDAPIDAIPDLSENQVIVFTEWPGRSPQVIEDQITYPLVTNLQALQGISYVRANSMFGMSFVYLIFNDDIDLYQARNRVSERLNAAARLLPAGVVPAIGPDGTGVGHVLWYTLDAPGMDLGEQRAIQDWYVRPGLQTVAGVSEIASFGGFQKQYEITVDPVRLAATGLTFRDIRMAVEQNNSETGGRKFEIGGASYVIRTSGYMRSAEDISNTVIQSDGRESLRIADIATVQTSSEARTGIFDLNGDGEVVGGIVVMRHGANANETIEKVKAKMEQVAKGFPDGMKFQITYDRSELIRESIDSVRNTLMEEMIMIAVVVIIFLFHFRSALSILIQIPVTIAISFILLHAFGISSNIMSLTGIALAIGVIADNGIIMAENAYRQLAARQEELQTENP